MFTFNPQTRFKRIASLLAIGAAVPAFAFFVGSQSGGGDASLATAASKAGNSQNGDRRGGPMEGQFLTDLATKLGVEEADLKAALESARPATKPKRKSRAAHQKELATALGVTTAELRAAMKKLRASGDLPAPPKGERSGPRGHGGPGGPGMRGPGGPPPEANADFAEALADALGIDTAKVTAAFEQQRAAHEAEHAAHRKEFAQKIADKLGISVDKVSEALEALKPPKPGRP